MDWSVLQDHLNTTVQEQTFLSLTKVMMLGLVRVCQLPRSLAPGVPMRGKIRTAPRKCIAPKCYARCKVDSPNQVNTPRFCDHCTHKRNKAQLVTEEDDSLLSSLIVAERMTRLQVAQVMGMKHTGEHNTTTQYLTDTRSVTPEFGN